MRRTRSRRRRERYYYNDSDSFPYRRRRGCLYRVKRFARTLFTTLLLFTGGVLLMALLIVLLVHLQRVIQAITDIAIFVRTYGPFALLILVIVAGAFTLLGIAYGVIRIIASISTLLSSASTARAKAHQEQAKVKLATLAQQRETVKITQQREDARMRRAQPPPLPQQRSNPPIPGRARHITQQLTEHLWRLSESQEIAVHPAARPNVHSVSLAQEERRPRIPGMPQLPGPCYYRAYQHLIGPGQLAAGIRQNGELRLGSWADYKIVLALGGSSSGKTTTIAQMVLGAANQGGKLVICDPHGRKPDSLLRKIAPIEAAALPGTTFAIDHVAIMANVEAVKAELERRVAGGDCSVPIFLVIEELNRLQRDKGIARSLTEILEAIGQEGRGFNIFCIIGAQKITGLPQIRKAVIAFIVHRVDTTEAQLCIPMRYAKYASELAPGQSFVKDADGVTEALQQVMVSVEDFEAARVRLEAQQHVTQHPHPTPVPRNATLPYRKPAITSQSERPVSRTPKYTTDDPTIQISAHPVPTWADTVLVPEPAGEKLMLFSHQVRTEPPVSPDAPTEIERMNPIPESGAERKLEALLKQRKSKRNG